MEEPPMSGDFDLADVHGTGCQRSDPKSGVLDSNSPFYLGTTIDGTEMYGNGPQGDVIRIDNYVRLVRDGNAVPEPGTLALALLGLLSVAVLTWRQKR